MCYIWVKSSHSHLSTSEIPTRFRTLIIFSNFSNWHSCYSYFRIDILKWVFTQNHCNKKIYRSYMYLNNDFKHSNIQLKQVCGHDIWKFLYKTKQHIYLPNKYHVFTIKTLFMYSTYIDIVFGSIPVSIPVIPGYRCTEKGLTECRGIDNWQSPLPWCCLILTGPTRHRRYAPLDRQ